MNNSKNKSKLVNIIALVLGCIVGYLLNITAHTDVSHTVFAPFGSLYIRVLQFVALPTIFCFIIVSIASLPNLKRIVSLALGALFSDIASAALVGVIAFFVTTFFIAQNYLTLTTTTLACKQVASAQNYMDKFMNYVPSNILGNFMKKYLLLILILAILFGILIVLKREKLDFLAKFIASTKSVLKKMLDVIVKFAPLGIFSIAVNAFASNDLGTLKRLFGLICMACVICLCYILVTTLIESIVTKKSFGACLVTAYPAIFFGFVTSASSACIPLAQKCADELGCKSETSSLVVPLTNMLIKTGSTMNIYCLLTFVIVAGGNVMPLYKWFFMIFLVMCCAPAVPSIPMGSIFVIPTALAYLGLTADQNLMGLLFAAYTFIDMLGTAATCASNVFCAVIVDKIRLSKR